MWLGLLRRFWPYLAGAALVILMIGRAHHAGYESGHAASEAYWKPAFEAAERERDAANIRAASLEVDSKVLSDQSEKRHAESLASLQIRASDVERSNRGLVRELASRASCRTLPEAKPATSVTDEDPAIAERIAGVADKFTGSARRCESDARQLSGLQEWIAGQQAIGLIDRP